MRWRSGRALVSPVGAGGRWFRGSAIRMPHPIRLLVAAAAAFVALAFTAALALAASPTSPPGGEAGDPRSSGQGPGLVGDPLWAIGLVVAIALLSLLATLAYVRMTANRGR